MNWFDVVPSIMSAVASVGAAFAAFGSLRVSREAKLVAEQSALASHHASAAITLTNAIEQLKKTTETFSDCAQRTWEEWPSEIERRDHRKAGGTNPRPLRHVLTNASEMLVKHATRQRRTLKYAQRTMFAIIRDGLSDLNDAEYEELLSRADGGYHDFEVIFGEPSTSKSIDTAPAFRWACYQLSRRIDEDSWYEIWKNAWLTNGWLTKFRSEQCMIKPTLELILSSLNSEKAKLAHSVFPLESNPSLYYKYEELAGVVEVLLEDCSLDSVEWYSKHPHKDDMIQLVVYSMGMAFLAGEALNTVHKISNWQ